MQDQLQLGIDIGGTFTDFVIYDPANGRLSTFKLLSSPHNPAEAVLKGLEIIRRQGRPAVIIHGSTVATNALLERKGARTAFIATQGFKDILQIGRQNRPELYDWFANPVPALVPEQLRFEVQERIRPDGSVEVALEDEAVARLLKELANQQVHSVAVCLLFSFANPIHEQLIARVLQPSGCQVSLSSEILPEYREYERASTTAVNAYVTPVLEHYLSSLETELSASGEAAPTLRIMQSNGGHISLAEARRFGVRCILSGPAGGIMGAKRVAQLASTTWNRSGEQIRIITFDMGGTSTDVSLVDGQARITTEASVSGCPIHIPVLDIHTIGAGGGSIASLDLGGALRVGPESAGADPGPACYGRGQLPTVTDANLVLGRLLPELFLGGEMTLDAQRADQALSGLGSQMELSRQQAALGIIAVVNAHMERALRVISVERGFDPGDFTLLSFGGAGGLHAVQLARNLGIPRVLVSPLASTLSAFGMLAADVVKDYMLTVMLPGTVDYLRIMDALLPLEERGRREVLEEGIAGQHIHIERSLDVRYQGQSYELKLPLPDSKENIPGHFDLLQAFHRLHQQTYGYARRQAAVEIVNIRVRAVGTVEPPALKPDPDEGPDPSAALLQPRRVVGQNGLEILWPVYRYEQLKPGNQISGPALIVRTDTTILLENGDAASLDGFYNILIEIGKPAAEM